MRADNKIDIELLQQEVTGLGNRYRTLSVKYEELERENISLKNELILVRKELEKIHNSKKWKLMLKISELKSYFNKILRAIYR